MRRERGTGRERAGKRARESSPVPWRELKMEPVSAFPGYVLQMTLKSSCSRAGFLRFFSVATVRSGIAVAQC